MAKTYIDAEALGVEKIDFLDKSIDLSPACGELLGPNVIFAEYEFLADSFAGINANDRANFLLPGSGDAFVSGDPLKLDLLAVPADLESVSLI